MTNELNLLQKINDIYKMQQYIQITFKFSILDTMDLFECDTDMNFDSIDFVYQYYIERISECLVEIL